MSRKSPGQDAGKPAEGYADRNIDGPTVLDITTLADLVDKIIDGCRARGYDFRPDVAGEWCGFAVYRLQGLSLPGLQVPSGFQYWARITPSQATHRYALTAAIKAIAGAEMVDAPGPVQYKWGQVVACFCDSPSDPQSLVARVAGARVGADAPTLIRTLAAGKGAHTVLPPLEWFPETLCRYTLADLLTLFPPAEADILSALLGRLAVGPSGTETLEGMITHTFRTFALIVGQEPGLGKSTLMLWLCQALATLGYTWEGINPELTRFGWGKVAAADLSWIDDLTEKNQCRFLESPQLKSMVSNTPVVVEEKGIPAFKCVPRTVIVGLTNTARHSDLFHLDPGILNRLARLDTRTSQELQEEFPDVPDPRLKQRWEAIAAETGTAPITIAAYVLRLCADRFLTLCGYGWQNGRLVVEGPDTLQSWLEDARSRLRLGTSIRHLEEVPEATARLLAWAIARLPARERPEKLEKILKLPYGPSLLLQTLVVRCETADLPDGCRLESLNPTCLSHIKFRLLELKGLARTVSVAKFFETVTAELTSVQGFAYPSKLAQYQVQWEFYRRAIPTWVEEFVAADLDIGSDVSDLLIDLRRSIKD